MASKTRVIQKIIQKPTLMAGAIFAVVAIIIIQLLGILADKIPFVSSFVNGGFNAIGPGFYMLLIAAAVIVPFWALDKTPGIKGGEVAVVLGAFIFATLFLVLIAPHIMPEFFPEVYSLPTESIKMSMFSMLGI